MAGFCVVLMMMGLFLPILIIAVVIISILIVVTLFKYFMESFAIYRMCKNSNYNHPILAWIPFYNRVLLGDFADNKKLGLITFILNIIYLLVFVAFIGFDEYMTKSTMNILSLLITLLAIIIYVLNIVLAHYLMEKSIPKVAVPLSILNVVTFGISKAIILFILRNNKKIIKQES